MGYFTALSKRSVAALTAALAVMRMEQMGQAPDQGPIAITGATGGVGSIAIDLFSAAGYGVHAISGKTDHFDWLKSLGASECFSRHELEFSGRPLDKGRWAGAVDVVGGDMLANLCTAIRPWGNIAACGLAGGIKLNTTVMPFIIRGVTLTGIDSPMCPVALRDEIWPRLAGDWRLRHLESIRSGVVSLDQLDGICDGMMHGDSLGRVLVKP